MKPWENLQNLFKPFLLLGGVILSLWVLNIKVILPFPTPSTPSSPSPTPPLIEAKLTTFNSCSQIVESLKNAQASQTYFAEKMLAPATGFQATDGIGGGAEEVDYSQTNVQVEGVDEADIVKTDGQFIYYVLPNQNQIVIAKAYPPNQATILSRINLGGEESVNLQEIFVEGNFLLLIAQKYGGGPIRIQDENPQTQIYPPIIPSTLTLVKIYDVFDRASPEVVRSLELEGDYISSRKIGDKVYLVTNTNKYYAYPMGKEETGGNGVGEANGENEYGLLPLYSDTTRQIKASGSVYQPLVKCGEVGELLPIQSSNFLSVVGLSMTDPQSALSKKVLLGGSEKVYASTQNLYIASTTYPFYLPYTPFTLKEEKTKIFKFALSDGKVLYQGEGEVKGWVLNQFSMDEWQGNFRIATTLGHVSRGGESVSSNNLYVLDENLKQIGKIEDIAPGEQIYSARFMGDKGFLVTFQKVDPFFTLDLKDPENPKIIGKLKIPGYSDYLHPLDANHMLGLGKEAVAAEQGDFAWYQGLKMAIFDVTDYTNPVEVDKVVIGDRGSDSYALQDHKAFLYDRQRGLLVIPVLLAEIKNKNMEERLQPQTYGDYIYQGAYIYKVSSDFKFELVGRVTHYPADTDIFLKSGYFYYGDEYAVKRSLYIGDYLYTLSEKFILSNHLFDLAEATKISL